MSKPLTFALAARLAAAPAFVNTNAGAKLYVCATPQPTVLDSTAFAALTWVLVGGVGNFGETGTSTNIVNYDTWDTDFIQKAKGTSNAGDPEIEVARDPADAGQDILRTIAATRYNYAFKIERTDKPTDEVGAKPTIVYNRGIIVGPRTPNGRNEDFDLEIFTLGLNQKQIVVDPVDPV